MVVLIVAIVMIAKLVSRSMGDTGGGRKRDRDRPARINDGESERLREEVRTLKERLAVLERIATDGNNTLERQIEALRDPPRAELPRRDRAPYGQEQD
jgi:hypothetical protein